MKLLKYFSSMIDQASNNNKMINERNYNFFDFNKKNLTYI